MKHRVLIRLHQQMLRSHQIQYHMRRCDQCFQYHALPRIFIGDKDYLKMVRYSNEYMQFQIILSFAYLVAHISHIEQKSVKRGAVSKGHMPFLQVITYESRTLISSEVESDQGGFCDSDQWI